MNMAAVIKLMEQPQLMKIEGGELYIPVQITDAKAAYGAFRFLVRPVGGGGTKWVDAARIITKEA